MTPDGDGGSIGATGLYAVRLMMSMRAAATAMKRGDFEATTAAAERIGDLALAHEGPDASMYASALGLRASAHELVGDLETARELYEEALRIQRLRDDDAEGLVGALTGLGNVARKSGRYEAAESLYREALAIDEQSSGHDSLPYARDTTLLATLYTELGAYGEAERLFEGALETLREAVEADTDAESSGVDWEGLLLGALGGDSRLASASVQYAQTLVNLGVLRTAVGRYPEAEACFHDALEAVEEVLGPESVVAASALNNLGTLYQATGALDEAGRFYRRAHDIRQTSLAPTHPDYVSDLVNLAGVDIERARRLRTEAQTLGESGASDDGESAAEKRAAADELLDAAAQTYRSALETLEAGGQATRRPYATVLNNLAGLHHERGEYEAARDRYEAALDVLEAVDDRGRRSDGYATALANLGVLYHGMERFDDAESTLETALERHREVLGDRHRQVATDLSNLAVVYAATGRDEAAIAALDEAGAIHDALLESVFAIGSEEQRADLLRQVRHDLDRYLTLVLARPDPDPALVGRAFDLVLRRKGLGAEALLSQRAAALGSHHPELRETLGELVVLTGRVARRHLDGPVAGDGDEADLAALEADRRELERELARSVPAYRLWAGEDLDEAGRRHAVAAGLDAGSALVEFLAFRRLDHTVSLAADESQWGPKEYVAFVLRPEEPDRVTLVELGTEREVKRAFSSFRTAVARDRPGLLAQVGPSLRARVFDPLVEAVDDAEHLVLAVDGELSKLAFELLPLSEDTDDGGPAAYLLDRYTFSYVTTGRDVAAFGRPVDDPGPPLVVAGPDYWFGLDPETRDTRQSGDDDQSGDRRRQLRFHTPFTALTNAEAEGEEVTTAVGGRSLVGAAATEGAVVGARSPRVLHVTTHGFAKRPHEGPENPMLRAGLALAGANAWRAGHDLPAEAGDGLLLAGDVTGMDLLDTELVVLSACLTGEGDVEDAEGVYGLRRAFAVAGARSLIVSLWAVPDEPTRALVRAFYDRLVAGDSRVEAFQAARQSVREEYPDPRAWGSFVLQGEHGPLVGDGPLPAPTSAADEPTAAAATPDSAATDPDQPTVPDAGALQAPDRQDPIDPAWVTYDETPAAFWDTEPDHAVEPSWRTDHEDTADPATDVDDPDGTTREDPDPLGTSAADTLFGFLRQLGEAYVEHVAEQAEASQYPGDVWEYDDLDAGTSDDADQWNWEETQQSETTCTRCSGRGYHQCPDCSGTGRLWSNTPPQSFTVPCGCQNGYVHCQTCRGRGTV